MADFSTLSGQRPVTYGADTNDSTGTTITSGASNTKGSFTEIASATTQAHSGIMVSILLAASTDLKTDSIIDIAIGAASEQIIVPDLIYSGGASAAHGVVIIPIPVGIPSGTRISARVSSETASTQFEITITGLSSGLLSPSNLNRVDAYGVVAASSGGTNIDPGSTINTKGGAVELTAGTTKALKGFFLGIGSNSNPATTTGSWLLDIMIGAATEQVILKDIMLRTSAVGDSIFPKSVSFIPMQIPKGTRISARAQSTIDNTTDRIVDVIFYGVR